MQEIFRQTDTISPLQSDTHLSEEKITVSHMHNSYCDIS